MDALGRKVVVCDNGTGVRKEGWAFRGWPVLVEGGRGDPRGPGCSSSRNKQNIPSWPEGSWAAPSQGSCGSFRALAGKPASFP